MFSEFSDGLPGWRLPQLLFSTDLTSLAAFVKRWKWRLLRYNRGNQRLVANQMRGGKTRRMPRTTPFMIRNTRLLCIVSRNTLAAFRSAVKE
jgi:hypothetical protein